MRSKFSWLLLLMFVIGGVIWWGIMGNSQIINSQILKSSYQMFNPKGEIVRKEQPYDKYMFERLAERDGVESKIEVVGNIFYYYSEGRRISGEINLPTQTDLGSKYPVVVMARGYSEKEGYKTGTGTRNAAAVYAKNGYITLAPDFSGYGESDPEDANALGARLVKPVEILDLLASLGSIPQADLSRVYLWGHSNGGQIMLSVAEILGRVEREKVVLGVTLWAPVTKPFPYNILYYTDEASDSGKWLRGEISKFEADYDVYKYSIDKYLDWINIPIQLHQGGQDEAVPQKWSDQFVKNLRERGKEVDYFVYPGADHNMRPNWSEVVARDVAFFASLN